MQNFGRLVEVHQGSHSPEGLQALQVHGAYSIFNRI
jgi:hypothetical protein